MAFNARIRIKKDTAANWETNNPVLLDGELVIVQTNAGDTRFKIGDGTKTYTQLPFQDESLYSVLSSKATEGYVDAAIEAISAIATTSKAGLMSAEDKEKLDDLVDSIELIDARSDQYDMDQIIQSGPHKGWYDTNADTLGTPSKYGLHTSYKRALILSYSALANHGHQVAFLNGGPCILTRRYYNGILGNWEEVYSTGNKPTPQDIGAAAVDPTDDSITVTKFKGDLVGNADTATTATNATTATKLGSSDVGSATQPIYLDDGAPKTCTYTLGKSVPSDAKFTDTDTKVNVTLGTTTKAYLLGTSTTPTSSANSVTTIADTGVYLNTTAGSLTATKFVGDLIGNADTATSATTAATASKLGSSDVGTATQPVYLDGGSPVACTYTLGKSVPSDAKFTDTNTKVTQTVTTTDAAYPLLATATASKTTTSTEGARFASSVTLNPSKGQITATEFVGDLTGNADTATSATSATTATTASKLGSSTVGGTTTPIYLNGGTPTACSYTLNKSVPSNAVFTDTNTKVNVTLGTTTKAYLMGTSTTPTSSAQGVTAIADTGVYLDTTAGTLTATKFKGDLAGNADTATSADSADTASKLGTNAGSATQPVYFSGGIPVKTTYTLGKSVPSDAKFTDTTYSAATTSAAGLMSAEDKEKLDNIGDFINGIEVIDARSDQYDMDQIIQSGPHKGWYDTDANTLGTPSKHGLYTNFKRALILSYSGYANYGYQVAILNGGPCMLTRRYNSGSLGNWEEVYSTGNKPTADDVGALSTAGGVLSGSLTVIDNFNINKTFDGVEYKTYIRPLNYALGEEYTTGLIHYNNGVNNSQLLFNKNGVAFRDNVNSKLYQLFGQHNAATAATSIRSQLYTYGTTDLTAGTSELATGKLHFVYE